MAETQSNAGTRGPEFRSSEAAELLVRCLSSGCKPLAVGREPIDWNAVVDVAVCEHVAPLFFKRLKESDAQALVPADAWERLRWAYFTNGDRNTRLYRELRTALERLSGAGIRVIVLKGAYLAEAVYGDVALRPMADVDLLVLEPDIGKAQAVLLDMGGTYLTQHNNPARARAAQANRVGPVSEETRHVLPLSIRDLHVELHWTIVSPNGQVGIDAAGLWSRARPASVAGVTVLALSPEDLLLHICLHVCYQHRLAGLRFLCDVAETTRRFRGELDWPLVTERAREWNAVRHVGLALHLAAGMLGASVPDGVLQRLTPDGIDPRLLETATRAVIAPTLFREMTPLSEWLGVRSIGEMEKLFWSRVFLSPEEMAAKYPASRGSKHRYLYYALRFRDGLRAAWALARRRAQLLARSRARELDAALDDWLKSGKT